MYTNIPSPSRLLFIFSWRIIALQCCVGFCHTSAWISHRYKDVPSLMNLPPTPPPPPIPLLQVATEHQLECPVSYSKFLWAFCFTYNNVYVFMLLSQFIPLFSSLLCPQVCSLYLCLYCSPTDRFINMLFLDSICMHWYPVFVLLFLTYFTLYNRL